MHTSNLGELLKQTEELEAVQLAAGETMEFSLESMMSFGEFMSTLSDSLSRTIKSIINYHETADMDHPASAASLHDSLDDLGFSKVRSVDVYRVPLQTAPMSEFLDMLSSQLDAFQDVEKRLHEPMYKWLGRLINDTSISDKPWIDRKLSFNDVQKQARTMSTMYQNSRVRTDDSEIVAFINMFPSLKHFTETERKMFDMYERLKLINLDSIVKLEKEINRRVDVILDLSDDPEEEFVFSKQNKVQLAKVFRGMAEETEYLVGLLFQANQAIGAWNNSVDSIKDYINK